MRTPLLKSHDTVIHITEDMSHETTPLLPQELYAHIYSFLDTQDLYILSQISKLRINSREIHSQILESITIVQHQLKLQLLIHPKIPRPLTRQNHTTLNSQNNTDDSVTYAENLVRLSRDILCCPHHQNHHEIPTMREFIANYDALNRTVTHAIHLINARGVYKNSFFAKHPYNLAYRALLRSARESHILLTAFFVIVSIINGLLGRQAENVGGNNCAQPGLLLFISIGGCLTYYIGILCDIWKQPGVTTSTNSFLESVILRALTPGTDIYISDNEEELSDTLVDIIKRLQKNTINQTQMPYKSCFTALLHLNYTLYISKKAGLMNPHLIHIVSHNMLKALTNFLSDTDIPSYTGGYPLHFSIINMLTEPDPTEQIRNTLINPIPSITKSFLYNGKSGLKQILGSNNRLHQTFFRSSLQRQHPRIPPEVLFTNPLMMPFVSR